MPSWILDYLPESGKQHCNQGLYYLQKDNPEPLERMQNTRDEMNFDVSLKRRSDDFFLDSSCVDIGYGVHCCGRRVVAAVEQGSQKLLSNKNFKLAEFLMQPQSLPTRYNSYSCDTRSDQNLDSIVKFFKRKDVLTDTQKHYAVVANKPPIDELDKASPVTF